MAAKLFSARTVYLSDVGPDEDDEDEDKGILKTIVDDKFCIFWLYFAETLSVPLYELYEYSRIVELGRPKDTTFSHLTEEKLYVPFSDITLKENNIVLLLGSFIIESLVILNVELVTEGVG